MKANLKDNLNALQTSDIYSLMFFILYKLKDVPEYATLSELCFLLDNESLTKLFTYFAGQKITIPTNVEFSILINALLLYEYINLDGYTLDVAVKKLNSLTPKQTNEAIDLYLKIIPIVNQYNIDRGQISRYARR